MINNSKNELFKKDITYKEIAMLLGITERQAINILSKENKSLYNYLVLCYITGLDLLEMFELTKEEKVEIDEKMKIIKQLKESNKK